MKNVFRVFIIVFVFGSCNHDRESSILLKDGMFMSGRLIKNSKEGRWLIKRKDSSLALFMAINLMGSGYILIRKERLLLLNFH